MRFVSSARWLHAPLLFISLIPVVAHAQAPEVKLPLRDNSIRFAVIGDNGTGKEPQYQIANLMERYQKVVKFNFTVMMGDNIYSGHRPADFVQKFEKPYKGLLDAGVKFYACLGNHDDPDIERNYQPFNMGGQRYYTHKHGDVEFFVIDSNYLEPRQMAWLESELKKSNAKWKIAYFHHPIYTAAKYHGPSVDIRKQLMPLFTKYGMNVVLFGHEHVYEHLKPQQGIYFFLEGSSGQLRYHNLSAGKGEERDEFGFDSDRTFMLMEISGDQLFYQTMSRDGKIIDAGVLNHQTPAKK